MQYMAGHISECTCAVIPPSSPVPWGINTVIRSHRCRAHKEVPVKGIRHPLTFGRPVESLWPDRPVSKGIYPFHIPYLVILYPFNYQVDTLSRRTLVSHLGSHFLFGGKSGK